MTICVEGMLNILLENIIRNEKNMISWNVWFHRFQRKSISSCYSLVSLPVLAFQLFSGFLFGLFMLFEILSSRFFLKRKTINCSYSKGIYLIGHLGPIDFSVAFECLRTLDRCIHPWVIDNSLYTNVNDRIRNRWTWNYLHIVYTADGYYYALVCC